MLAHIGECAVPVSGNVFRNMPKRGVKPCAGGRGNVIFSAQRGADLRKKKRIPLCAPCGHDARAARFCSECGSIRSAENIPVADDGNAHGIHNLRDLIPIRNSRIHLHSGSAVNGDKSSTGGLGHLCKFNRID